MAAETGGKILPAPESGDNVSSCSEQVHPPEGHPQPGPRNRVVDSAVSEITVSDRERSLRRVITEAPCIGERMPYSHIEFR